MSIYGTDIIDTAPTEAQMIDAARSMAFGSFVMSGMTLSDGGGTTLNVATGEAFVAGYRIEFTTTQTVTIGSANTYDVWLNPDGTLEWQTSPTSSDAISLGIVTGTGAAISSISYDRNVDRPTAVYRRKTADETTSSTTVQDDDDLYFSVQAGEVWELSGSLYVSNTGNDEIKLALQVPSGVVSGFMTGRMDDSVGYGPVDGSHRLAENYTASAQIEHSSRILGAGTLKDTPKWFRAIAVIGETAGTVRVRWASYSGTSTTVKAQSFLKARRIA